MLSSAELILSHGLVFMSLCGNHVVGPGAKPEALCSVHPAPFLRCGLRTAIQRSGLTNTP